MSHLLIRTSTRAVWNEDSFLKKRAADSFKELGEGAALDTEHDAEPVAKRKRLDEVSSAPVSEAGGARKKGLVFMDIAIGGRFLT